ncbi:purine-nucleoside phosphorylase [Nocardiopsis ansamitocini]|uniref:purine-nucleoside phosphorylase n=1 Tax=Nocardiopsis ansamitocini TaxID=1670832 RepID=A0A9W6P9G3_9ACTN|nr:purine-nucleoside phosphorylase [Nocardiopsis ansamitocini]GLU49571.1 purine nucleoside phosphorylase [Nocardiopsis ansamitocini]
MSSTAEAKKHAAAAAEELLERMSADAFDAVVILGPGFAEAVTVLGSPDAEVDPASLVGFGPAQEGSTESVHSVWVGAKHVLVFVGRTNFYDGYGPLRVAHAVRTGISTGARTVVLTDTVGTLRTDFQVGQPILVRDHINLMAASPLVGPDFVDLTRAYSQRLRDTAHEADLSLAEGVYGAVRGPQPGTPAELGLLRTAGADLVGSATVLETIAAVEMGAEVLSVSVVGEDALYSGSGPRDTGQLLAVAQYYAQPMGQLLNRFLLRL